MDLPELLIDAIFSAVRLRFPTCSESQSRQEIRSFSGSSQFDGFSGSNIAHLLVDHGTEANVSVFIKRWNPSSWIMELSGLTEWLERLLFETGIIGRIDSLAGLHVPIIGSARTDDSEWIIMEDVSAELAQWKDTTVAPGGPFWLQSPESLDLYADLLDRIARMHTQWEDSERRIDLRAIKSMLTRQEKRLRNFEDLFREWFDVPGRTATSGSNRGSQPSAAKHTQWASKENFTAARRGNYEAFLSRLSDSDRTTWIWHMQCRDALVEAAASLPQTLLHGDLSWRNIGLRRTDAGNEFTLIDWEFAYLGSHAMDVVGLVTSKAFSAEEQSALEERYFERYIHHGGRLLDRRTWKRACDVAIALSAVCTLPHFTEIVRKGKLDPYVYNIEALIGRASRVLHDLKP